MAEFSGLLQWNRKLEDDEKIYLGDSDDCEIYFDGTDLNIDSSADINLIASGNTTNYIKTSLVTSPIGSVANTPQIEAVGTIGLVLKAGTGSAIEIDDNLHISTNHALRLYDGDNSNYCSLDVATALAGNFGWKLPNAQGTTNQIIYSTDGTTWGWTGSPALVTITSSTGGANLVDFSGIAGNVTAAKFSAAIGAPVTPPAVVPPAYVLVDIGGTPHYVPAYT